MSSDLPGDQDQTDSLEEPQADPHSSLIHHHVAEPVDFSYRIAVRTVLWVIVGAVFVGFMIWWVLT
jgi:hypothetical protein